MFVFMHRVLNHFALSHWLCCTSVPEERRFISSTWSATYELEYPERWTTFGRASGLTHSRWQRPSELGSRRCCSSRFNSTGPVRAKHVSERSLVTQSQNPALHREQHLPLGRRLGLATGFEPPVSIWNRFTPVTEVKTVTPAFSTHP